MDDGEVELSDQVLLSNHDVSSDFQGSTSVDSILDGFLKNARTCTHTHTCNPPGPDAAHTHTCYHTHTHVLTSEEDEGPKRKRPSGNREAVRKYREKKKAHTVYLEEEVKKLRLLNQQLIRRLQGQAMLEGEVLRLRSLLLDLRGKIDNELGVFPFQKHCSSTVNFKEGDCDVQSIDRGMGLQCETKIPCFHSHVGSAMEGGSARMMIDWDGICEPAIVDCQAQAHPNGVVVQDAASSGAQPNCLIPAELDTVGALAPSASQAE